MGPCPGCHPRRVPKQVRPSGQTTAALHEPRRPLVAGAGPGRSFPLACRLLSGRNEAMKKPTAPLKQEGPNDKEMFTTWIAGYDAGNVDQVMSIFDPALRYI